MTEVLMTVAVSGLLFGVAFVISRRADDSYGALQRLLLAAVLMGFFFGALLVGHSISALVAHLGGPMLVGAVAGSWPDVLRRWPNQLRADLAGMRRALPDLLAGVLGLVLGVWAWSALAMAMGILGVLLGAVAFVVVVLGVGSVPTVISLIVESVAERRRRPSGPGGRTS